MEAYAAIIALLSNLRSALCIANIGDLKLIDDQIEMSLQRDLEAIGILGIARMRMPRLP